MDIHSYDTLLKKCNDYKMCFEKSSSEYMEFQKMMDTIETVKVLNSLRLELDTRYKQYSYDRAYFGKTIGISLGTVDIKSQEVPDNVVSEFFASNMALLVAQTKRYTDELENIMNRMKRKFGDGIFYL